MTREKANDLIERYLYKAGEELPAKQRDDVKAELRSLLLDALEDRAAEAGRLVDEELAVEVLRDFGKPEQVAERYRPPGQYLIGPRLFPVYIGVAKIVLIVLAGIFVVSVGIGALASPWRFPELFRPASVWDVIESFTGLAFVNLAILTIVFALIERFADTRPESGKVDWDPQKLPAVPVKADPERISPGDRIFKIYAIVALFLWVNQFPDTLGIWVFFGDQTRVIRFTEMGMQLPVVLLNIFWGLALALNMWVLRMGRWTKESRWAEFGLGLYGAAILYLVLVSSAFTGPEASELAGGAWWQWPVEMLRVARADLPRLGRILHAVLTFILGISLIEAVVRLVRILRRYPVW